MECYTNQSSFDETEHYEAVSLVSKYNGNCDFNDSLSIEYIENSISISADDDKLINKFFELSLCADGYEKTTIIVTIKAFI